jgi:hypothetical protein
VFFGLRVASTEVECIDYVHPDHVGLVSLPATARVIWPGSSAAPARRYVFLRARKRANASSAASEA